MRGRSEQQIAAQVFIRRLDGAPHIVPIDDKAGVSTSAGAAVFATEHGLLGGE